MEAMNRIFQQLHLIADLGTKLTGTDGVATINEVLAQVNWANDATAISDIRLHGMDLLSPSLSVRAVHPNGANWRYWITYDRDGKLVIDMS